MTAIPMTKTGFSALQRELAQLIRVERPKAIDAISDALGRGDISENAEYDVAKETQAILEGRIQLLSDKLARAQVIDLSQLEAGDRVVFGATVRLLDLDKETELEYSIVGEDEANIREQKLSITSPVAQALVGRTVGDEVSVRTPAGERVLEILGISFQRLFAEMAES